MRIFDAASLTIVTSLCFPMHLSSSSCTLGVFSHLRLLNNVINYLGMPVSLVTEDTIFVVAVAGDHSNHRSVAKVEFSLNVKVESTLVSLMAITGLQVISSKEDKRRTKEGRGGAVRTRARDG
ncbi:hypothetical protein DFS33DRAFT_1319856 [Desarmillaria ectypa]|nr:hypothetical protein DFS33DRAFT_1319856 [Desarmillaria ectypa]